jgi:hypothetical protein
LLRNYRPYGAIEEAEQRLRDEPAPRRKDMAITVSPLAMREETLRHKEVEFVAGARHCDVKKPTLLLDFGCRAGGKIGGDTPVDHIQHEHGAPFLSLGGMNGGKDQIVFIEQRRPRLVAGRVGRVERQFGQKLLARPVAGGDLLELNEIRPPCWRVVVEAIEMG